MTSLDSSNDPEELANLLRVIAEKNNHRLPYFESVVSSTDGRSSEIIFSQTPVPGGHTQKIEILNSLYEREYTYRT